MKRTFGFTLIELLVVVGIIGVLIAILLPSLGRSRERARQVACAANLHGYGLAIQTYISEFGRPLETNQAFGGANPALFWLYNRNVAPGMNMNSTGQVSLEALAPFLKGVAMDPVPEKVKVTKVWFCPSQGVDQPNTSPDAKAFGFIQMNYSYFARFDQKPLRNTATKPDELVGNYPKPGKVLMADDFFRWNNPPSPPARWHYNHGVSGATAHHQNGPFVSGVPKITGNNVLYGDFSVTFKKLGELVDAKKLDQTGTGNPNARVNGGGGDMTFY